MSFISAAGESPPKTILIFGGKSGWIGQKLVNLINQGSDDKTVRAVAARSRLECRDQVEKELDIVKPWRVICAAGVTGRPNVDYLETHKAEANRSNVIGILTLAELTQDRDIHLTNMATGCIYEYDDKHPMGSGKGFTERDPPNFTGSWYSLTKGMVEQLLSAYTNVLTLRLRMPISDDLHARNFITKIASYERVVDIPNSMSVLYDLLPVAIDLCIRKTVGVFNFVNPGVISHNEILEMYRTYLDGSFRWKNFSVEEQAKILEAGRSNNELCASKLVTATSLKIPHIKNAVQACFQRMVRNKVPALPSKVKARDFHRDVAKHEKLISPILAHLSAVKSLVVKDVARFTISGDISTFKVHPEKLTQVTFEKNRHDMAGVIKEPNHWTIHYSSIHSSFVNGFGKYLQDESWCGVGNGKYILLVLKWDTIANGNQVTAEGLAFPSKTVEVVEFFTIDHQASTVAPPPAPPAAAAAVVLKSATSDSQWYRSGC